MLLTVPGSTTSFCRNSTRLMPSASVAVAVRVRLAPGARVLLLAGAVRLTMGGGFAGVPTGKLSALVVWRVVVLVAAKQRTS